MYLLVVAFARQKLPFCSDQTGTPILLLHLCNFMVMDNTVRLNLVGQFESVLNVFTTVFSEKNLFD